MFICIEPAVRVRHFHPQTKTNYEDEFPPEDGFRRRIPRRRIAKTNSPKTNWPPKTNSHPKTDSEDEFPEDELPPRRRISPEDELPPKTNFHPKTNSPEDEVRSEDEFPIDPVRLKTCF